VRYGKTEGLAEERRRNGIIRAEPLCHFLDQKFVIPKADCRSIHEILRKTY